MKTLITVTALFALISCSSSKKESTATLPLVHDNGVNIVYTDSGQGDTTLLFVHGWGINRSYWSDQIPAFNRQYRVVAVDLPGFGESGRNRQSWHTVDFAHDIDSVITQLHLKNVILIGHSMSGAIVLQSAIDNLKNVIAFIGVDNFKAIGYTPTEKDQQMYDDMRKEIHDHYTKSVTAYFNEELVSPTTPDTLKNRILTDVFKNDSTIGYATITDDSFNDAASLKQSNRKLYLINSDYKGMDSTWLTTNQYPHQIYWVRGVGHYPMNEDPTEFNLQLRKALHDIGTAGRSN